MPRIISVCLNPALDKFVHTKRLSKSGAIRTLSTRIVAGGKAVNVARALKRFSLSAPLIGIVSGDAGESLCKTLSEEKLPGEWVSGEGETRTNLTIIPQDGKATRRISSGDRVPRRVQSEVENILIERMGSANAVILTGSLPPGYRSDTYARLIKIAREKNVMAVLDASGPALKAGIKAGPFIVKPNREEAREICGFRINSRESVKKALHNFSRHSNIVLLSLDEKGLAATDSARMFYATCPVRKGVSVGCGDAALAGFLAGFFKGLAFEDCLRWAAAAGTAAVGAPRPGLIQLRDWKSLVRKIDLERI